MTSNIGRRMALWTIGFLLLSGLSGLAYAHRLDELVQASYIDINPQRVVIELVLTPGTAMAERFYNQIDTNQDGRLSPAEQQRYSQAILSDVTLELDGNRQRLTLVKATFPSLVALTDGLGHIRLWVTASLPDGDAGEHTLFFQNVHQPMQSVYLLNPLLPTSGLVHITNQVRDQNQYTIRLTYTRTTWLATLPTRWIVVATLLLALSGLVIWHRVFIRQPTQF